MIVVGLVACSIFPSQPAFTCTDDQLDLPDAPRSSSGYARPWEIRLLDSTARTRRALHILQLLVDPQPHQTLLASFYFREAGMGRKPLSRVEEATLLPETPVPIWLLWLYRAQRKNIALHSSGEHAGLACLLRYLRREADRSLVWNERSTLISFQDFVASDGSSRVLAHPKPGG